MPNVLFQFGELDTNTFKDGEPIWIEALQAKTIHGTPWGDVVIDTAKLDRMATGIKNNIRGIELATDYEHGRDPVKGRKASGYIRDAKVENGSLHVAVEPTPVALSELRDKEWRYFSLDWEDQWKSNENGVVYDDVVVGGAFTNRPIAKGMMPINFAEVIGAEADAITFAIVPPVNQVEEEGDPGMTDEEKAALDKANAEIESLRKLFNLPADGDLVAAVTDEHKQFSELQAGAAKHSTAKKFAEEYPDEYRRMQMMEDHTRSTEAKLFSEKLSSRRVTRKEGSGDDAKDVQTGLGLSALALDKAEATHKKFAEGTATIEDFTGFVDVVFGGGVVEYGERGTSQGRENNDGDPAIPTNVISIRKQFSEFIDEVKARDTTGKMTYAEAYSAAKAEKPRLANAYENNNPQVEEEVAV